MRKLVLSLSFAMALLLVGLALPPSEALAAPPAGKTETVSFTWDYAHKGKGTYNPADKGTEVSFAYFLLFNGTDENGVLQKQRVVQMQYTGKVGEDSSVEVPVDSIVDIQGKTYTNCTFISPHVPIYAGNYVYSGSSNGNPGAVRISFEQNMNTQVTASIAPNSIILPADLAALPIRYTIARTYNGSETHPLPNGQNGSVIENTSNFAEGAISLWNDDERNDFSFRRALTGSQLDMFSAYTGKYKTYELHAEFAGEHKADLEKRYSLSVTGSDLDGWTLSLGSNIKEGVKESVEEIDFKTVYEDDPTLAVGETKVKQAGVKGKAVTKTPYYYIMDEQGKEEVLETHDADAVTETTAAIDEVILKGTMEAGKESGKEPAKKELDGKPGAKRAPQTSDGAAAGVAAIAVLGGAAALGLRRRREDQ